MSTTNPAENQSLLPGFRRANRVAVPTTLFTKGVVDDKRRYGKTNPKKRRG
jgi:hypothetical protein